MSVTHASAPLEALRGVDREGARQPERVSVAGVVLLSALAVTLTIVGVALLGAFIVAAYWLISHIPLPAFVWHAVAQVRAIL